MDATAVKQEIENGIARLRAQIDLEVAQPCAEKIREVEREILIIKGTVDQEVKSMKDTIDAGVAALRQDNEREVASMKLSIDAEMAEVKKRVMEWEGKQKEIKDGIEAYANRTKDETVKSNEDAKGEMERTKRGVADMYQ